MKAAILTRYGGPEVLEIREVPPPVPRDDEVLIRVHASTVCYGDRLLRQGPPLVRLMNGLRRPKTTILGVDLSGTVVATGRSVTRFAPGDAVFGSRGDKFGAYAEFACVAETGFLARKPATMTFEEAATLFVGGVCSLYFLRKARIQPGARVLIHGASGSLGTFAVQLAKHYGAHVTAVCGSTNADLMMSLGADAVIDYTKQDFTRDGPAYDVVCDVMAKAGFPGSLKALKPGGRYLLVGFPESIPAIVAALARGFWAHLRGRATLLTGPAAPVQADLEFLKARVESGELRTVIGSTFPLDRIVDAHRHADSGHKVGNLVIAVEPGAN